jgi:hypothetical protein
MEWGAKITHDLMRVHTGKSEGGDTMEAGKGIMDYE